jgi:hypothetical protein
VNGYPAANNRSNDAPIYSTLPDSNLGGVQEPFTLGDQFQLLTPSIIDSVTIYEVGNVALRSMGIASDTPDTEFSSVSLFIGPDNTGLGQVSTLSGAALKAASTQVFYTVGTNQMNYQSINMNSYFPIFAITFSGLNLTEDAGLYDFAIGATPTSGNSFALLMSDPSQGPAEDSLGIPGHSFLYFFNDGPGGTPLATYQYAGPADLSNWSNPNAMDVNVIIQGSSVPEPATFGFVALALGGVLLARKSGFRMLK